MDIKTALIGSVASLALIVASIGTFGAAEPQDTQGKPQDKPLGALAGPDIPSPYLRWGDVADFRARTTNFVAASTTVCAIQNPANATTTLETVTFQISEATSTAAKITIATSTSPYATTTTLALVTDYNVAASKRADIAWQASGTNTHLLGPSEYVIVKTAGAGLGGYTFGGSCQISGIAL